MKQIMWTIFLLLAVAGHAQEERSQQISFRNPTVIKGAEESIVRDIESAVIIPGDTHEELWVHPILVTSPGNPGSMEMVLRSTDRRGGDRHSTYNYLRTDDDFNTLYPIAERSEESWRRVGLAVENFTGWQSWVPNMEKAAWHWARYGIYLDAETILYPYYTVPANGAFTVYTVAARQSKDRFEVLYGSNGLTNNIRRGFMEPHIAQYKDRLYMTMRAEDGCGYVTTSDNKGRSWQEPKAWTWEDGSQVPMRSTMTKLLSHSEGLILVYTRVRDDNDNVMRNRAPLLCADVDPAGLSLKRSTERIIVPNKGMPLGNFGVWPVNQQKSYVVVAEWPRDNRKENGDVWLAKIYWKQLNRQMTPDGAEVVRSTVTPLDHPSFAQVEDVPGLPRVLLIGDSISMHYTIPVRQRLEGVANVHRPPQNCRSTRQTLAELDDYLGQGQWDIISFNWGIHDITCKNEAGKAAPPPEGRLQVPLDEYKKNLKTLVQRLKKTGARLIWVSTTPVGRAAEAKGYRKDSDVTAYNAAAAKIMESEGVMINDLYTVVKPRAEELLKDGVHFNPEGINVTAEAVAQKIREVLKIQDLRQIREKAAHRQRRLIYDNDGCDIQFLTEPTRQAFLAKRMAPLVGTQVDTIFYCTRSSGFGLFTYNTQIGEIFTCTEGRFKDNKTGYFIEQGTDALKMTAEFCKENQIELFWSMRMNDCHDASDDLGLPQLKRDHPEWLMNPNRGRLKTRYGAWSAVDYGVKEIRDMAYAYCQEVCQNYDIDGIHLDFFRHPLFFRDQAEGKHVGQKDRDLMTELIRRIRTMTEEVGLQKGTPLLFSVRVPDSIGYCNAIGLDIERWMREGLIDIMVASGYCRLNPWEITVELGHKYKVPVYACLSESRHRDERAKQIRNSVEVYRARAMNAWSAGADGICLFNIFNVFDPQNEIFTQLGDPKTLATLDKVYTTGGRVAVYAEAYLVGGAKFLNRQLVSPETPLALTPGKPETVNLMVGENIRQNIAAGHQPDIHLALRLPAADGAPPALSVNINGGELPDPAKHEGMLTYSVSPAILKQGPNRIEITLAPDSAADTRIDDLQLCVNYPP